MKRLGHVGYVELLAAIAARPKSALQIEAETGWRASAINTFMKRMHRARIVHVGSWTEPSKHTVPQPMFVVGRGEDVAPPLTYRGTVTRHQAATFTVKPGCNAVVFATAIHAMSGRPRAKRELVEQTGANWDAVRLIVDGLHARGLAHIACWVRSTSGPPAPHFEFGPGGDAPRPRALGSRRSGPRIEHTHMHLRQSAQVQPRA